MCHAFINIITFEILLKRLRKPHLQLPKTCVFVSAVNLAFEIKHTRRSHKDLLKLVSVFLRLLVVPPCPLLPLVSTWQRAFLETRNLRKRLVLSLVLAMVPFVTPTSTCTIIERGLLIQPGLLMGRVTWQTSHQAEHVQ